MVEALSDWTPTVFLDPRSDEPVYLQIAHALIREVERGRFRPGDPLPGYRKLAGQLGVVSGVVGGITPTSVSVAVARPGTASASAKLARMAIYARFIIAIQHRRTPDVAISTFRYSPPSSCAAAFICSESPGAGTHGRRNPSPS